MSAMIGILAARVIWLSALVLASSGQETRIKSAPASSQRRIWSIVATASEVGVLVMVCTVIGASPPTGTLPTMICRDWRRAMALQGWIGDLGAPISEEMRRHHYGGLWRRRDSARLLTLTHEGQGSKQKSKTRLP